MLPYLAPARWPGWAFPILMLLSLGSGIWRYTDLDQEALGTASHSVCGTPSMRLLRRAPPDTFPPAPQVRFYKPLATLLQCRFSVAVLTRPPLPLRMNTLLPLLCFLVPVFL